MASLQLHPWLKICCKLPFLSHFKTEESLSHIVNSNCSFLSSEEAFPCSSVGKGSACSAGDPGSIPGLGRSPGVGNGNRLQYPCLENLMDRGAWWAAVHGVTKSRTRLSIFTFTFHFHALEKEMATHSSVLAWRIPGTEKPFMGSHRVGHD